MRTRYVISALSGAGFGSVLVAGGRDAAQEETVTCALMRYPTVGCLGV